MSGIDAVIVIMVAILIFAIGAMIYFRYKDKHP